MPNVTCQSPPGPKPIKLLKNPLPFNPVDWVTVVKWEGTTDVPLRFKITVVEDDVEVEWRKYGVGLHPYATGTFVKQAYVTVYPSDLWMAIQLRVPVNCNIKVVPL